MFYRIIPLLTRLLTKCMLSSDTHYVVTKFVTRGRSGGGEEKLVLTFQ